MSHLSGGQGFDNRGNSFFLFTIGKELIRSEISELDAGKNHGISSATGCIRMI
jgi:hypothetical protein